MIFLGKIELNTTYFEECNLIFISFTEILSFPEPICLLGQFCTALQTPEIHAVKPDTAGISFSFNGREHRVKFWRQIPSVFRDMKHTTEVWFIVSDIFQDFLLIFSQYNIHDIEMAKS